MIEETGQIIALEGQLAKVRIQRHGSCGGCTKQQGECGVNATMQMLASEQITVIALNQIQARIGEQVILGLEEAKFLNAAVLLYGIPILALIGGIIIGQKVGFSAQIGTELTGLIGGLLGVSVGLAWVKYRTRQSNIKFADYQAVILRLDQHQSTQIGLNICVKD